jgi:YbbR domain-containing protein
LSFIKSIFGLLRFNKKNWKPVVLCLFAATVFWFFNALNKSYTTNIRFPLNFDYNTINYVPVGPLPNEVAVNVTGIGWSLFRKSYGVKVSSLVIPLERPSEVRKIVGSTLPGLFSNQLEGIQINFVLTDTLYINIQPKAGRWLSLKIDSLYKNVRKGYTIVTDVVIEPDSFFVEGPMSMVTHLKEPVPLIIKKRNIEDNFDQEVELTSPDNQLMSINPSIVNVSFNVDKLVERTDSIRLTLKNIPPRARPFMETSYLLCTIAIPQSMEKQYKPEDVTAVVDLNGFRKGELKIRPELQGLPPHSQVIKIDSIRIKL